jgi:hypothetical protein
MTSERTLLVSLSLALLAGACGNYSNEDLEFMNAVPTSDGLTVSLPPKPLSTTDEAELAANTHDQVRNYNTLIDTVMAYVETVRSYEPTSRGHDSQGRDTRTWGPAPATDDDTGAPNGWRWRFVMTRNAESASKFHYQFDLQPIGGADDEWTLFISGDFDAAVGLRRGNGNFLVDFQTLRTLGYPFKDDGKLASIAVTYATAAFPTSVSMMLVATDGTTAGIEYSAQADGSGALSFTLTGDLIKLTPALETLAVTALWLPSGAGRADEVVQSGDGAGLHRTECWNSSFVVTYEDKAWDATSNFGDLATDCPAISGF